MYVSKTYCGKTHDYQLLKSEFPCAENWFEYQSVRLDSGFQGFNKDYACVDGKLPIKKTRAAKDIDNGLTNQQKQDNQKLAQERVVVENSIAGLKRYNLISNCLRIKLDADYLDDIILIAAGLWNFNINK